MDDTFCLMRLSFKQLSSETSASFYVGRKSSLHRTHVCFEIQVTADCLPQHLDAAIIVDVLMLHRNFSKLVVLCASQLVERAELAGSSKLRHVTKVRQRIIFRERAINHHLLELLLFYCDWWL